MKQRKTETATICSSNACSYPQVCVKIILASELFDMSVKKSVLLKEIGKFMLFQTRFDYDTFLLNYYSVQRHVNIVFNENI